MFLMFQLRRLDVWPVGDLAVRKGYGLAWKVPTPDAQATRAARRTVTAVPQRRRVVLLASRAALRRRGSDGTDRDRRTDQLTNHNVMVPTPSGALERRLGLGDAVVIGLGSMIGAGVFAAFAPAAKAAGAGLLIGLAVAAIVAYCNATSSARLAALYPESGGTYVYGRRRLGDFWGYRLGGRSSSARPRVARRWP